MAAKLQMNAPAGRVKCSSAAATGAVSPVSLNGNIFVNGLLPNLRLQKNEHSGNMEGIPAKPSCFMRLL